MAVSFELNGELVRVGKVDPHTTLLQWLRARGLTGSKEGCAEGECGACAVAVVTRDPAGGAGRLDPVNSCLVPVLALDGQSIVTVEGVADPTGAPHPVQRMMAETGGSQCGYCTPGFVVSLFCEYYRPGRDGYDPEAISGNLCRCTGYRPIADVARALPLAAVQPADDPRRTFLARPSAALRAVDETYGDHRFLRPTSLTALLDQLVALPEAVLIAGGTDLMVYANQRYQRFPTLIGLEAIPELRRFEVGGDEIVIGAGVTLSEIEARVATELREELSILHQVLRLFSSRLIRNRATLGGNLGTASPIGDSPPALLALDAEVTVASAARGERRIALADFFLGYRQTALRPGEVIVSVHLPRPLPVHQLFYKVSKRVLDDISTVAAGFGLDLTPDGKVARLRIAYGGVAATPVRARAVEALAVGQPWTRETVAALVAAVDGLGTPMSDQRGSAEYRRRMMGKLIEKAHADTTDPAGSPA